MSVNSIVMVKEYLVFLLDVSAYVEFKVIHQSGHRCRRQFNADFLTLICNLLQ